MYRNCGLAGDQTDFKSLNPGSDFDLNNIVQVASLLSVFLLPFLCLL